jgi:asparagine synthase (glutamine-hydrolysing)
MLPQGSCRLRRRSLVSRVELASRLLGCTSAVEFYRAYTSQWPQLSISGSDPAPSYGFVEDSLCANINFIERMMAEDTAAYLPDDVLTKVDRASMSVSLETRVPLLDHRVVELAWRIPFGMKVRGGSPKHLLRQVLRRHVPAAIIDRPKMGFGVPVDRWLRGPLRDWAEALIDPVRIRHDGYLNSELVQHRWEQHQSGRNNWRDSLWLVMMWQAWLHEGPK